MDDSAVDVLAMDDPEVIRDELALYEGVLASLRDDLSTAGHDTETEDALRDTRSRLKALRKQLRRLTSTSQASDPHDIPIREHQNHNLVPLINTPGSSVSQTPVSTSSDLSEDLMPRHLPDVAGKKRQRPDLFHESRRHSKSRRTSPSPSSFPSPASSTASLDSLDFEDPFLTSLFGNNTESTARERRALAEIQDRKQQEQRDAHLALKLSQDWNSSTPQHPVPKLEYSQSFFKPDGTINRIPRNPAIGTARTQPTSSSTNLHPERSFAKYASTSTIPTVTGQDTSQRPQNLIKPEPARNDCSWTRSTIKSDPLAGERSGNMPVSSKSRPIIASNSQGGAFTLASSANSSSSSLEEIPATKFVPRGYPPTGLESRILPPPSLENAISSPQPFTPSIPFSGMPGAFPGSPLYTSSPGSSVYLTSTSYNAPNSALGRSSHNLSLPTSSQGLDSSGYSISSRIYPQSFPSLVDDDPSEEVKELLKNIRPDEELEAADIIQPPPGLAAQLMPHQLKGLAWMRKMEESSNKGGILADDMGLGKTVQSIALILDRPPPATRPRPTLIVAPVALLQQWQREIEKMVNPRHRLNTLIYHGSTKNVAWAALKSYDVVFTTYGLLASELKRHIAWEEKLKLVPGATPTASEQCSILGEKSSFHRIILDEAQNIKNKNAKAALAAFRINADYRWALTGTPMMNGPEEIYSLVKFCRIKPYSDWNKFHRDIGSSLKPRKRQTVHEVQRANAMERLQALLRAILLRRTKQSEIDGKPILQLPPKHTVEDRVAFDEDELTFYRALESKAQIQFNKYLSSSRGGGIGQNYSNALVLLLRLRQACCHPRLVVDSKDFMIQLAGSLSPNDLITNAAELDKRVVARLKEMDAFECPICMDASENPAVFPCGHTLCNDCLSRLVEQVANTEEDGRPSAPKCPHCRAIIDSRKITDIVSFLRVHDPSREGLPPLDDEDEDADDSDTDSDVDDSDDGSDLKGFIVPDDFLDDDESDVDKKQKGSASKLSGTNAKGGKKFKKRKASKPRLPQKSLAVLRKEGLKSKAAKQKYLRRLEKTFQPSAKTNKSMEILEEIRSRGENEKTIIFSNFTSFLDLLEVPLNNNPDFRGYVRYDGSMSAAERNTAVLEFTDNPNCRVILVSLKAGNAGLNLTVANHVIMLDPFWNPFVEYQAADRCYRIGQGREVTVHRVLISDEGFGATDPEKGATVEDRILALQERKRDLVETALDEPAGRNVARLGVRELGYLFGLNRM